MKCPHCNYEDETYDDDGIIHNEHGGFFKMSGTMKQPEDINRYTEYAHLFGCPSCDKTFIERTYL